MRAMLNLRYGNTLKFRVALLTVFLGLVSLALIGIVNFQVAKEELKNERFRYLSDLVERIATDIDHRVAIRRQLLVSAVRNVHPARTLSTEQAESLLDTLKPLAPMFDTLVVYSRDGVIMADSPRDDGRRGLDIHDRDYFTETRDTLKPLISVPLRTRNNPKRHIVLFTVPLTDPQGRFIGMVGGSLELLSEGFFRDLESITIGNTGYITINAIRSQLNLYHPDTNRVFLPVPSEASSPASSVLPTHAAGTLFRDIKAMSKAGINDDTIMDLIDSTHSVFYLSADDIIDMKKSATRCYSAAARLPMWG